MKKFKFLVFVTSIVLLAAFGREASAAYYSSGTLTSTNLLSGLSVGSIDSFWYNALSIPAGASLRVQFSNDGGSTWYNSAGTLLNGWNNCTSTGGADISLSGLGWSTAEFRYKMEFNGGTNTPVLEAVRVDYSLPNQLPSCSLVASPDLGTAPLTVTLNGSGSSDPDGTIAKYEWDWTDDGTYDYSESPGDGIATNIYNTAGSYTARLRVTDNGGANATCTAGVSVSAPPVLNVSPTTLTFSATQGGSNPSNQGSTVWNTGGGTLSWTASDNQTWLSISPTSYTGNSTTLWAIVDITGLSAGSYSGTITVTGAAGTQNSPQTVTVNLTVNAACTNTAPSVTTLSSPSNGATGQSTSPTVSWNAVSSWGVNCAGNTNTYQVFLDTNSNPTTSRGTVASGTTSLAISGLANGTIYYWKVRASNGALSTDSSVWSFTTVALPYLNVSPTTLTFSATQGGSNPSNQGSTVWNTGGGTLSWTASDNQTWLSISPTSYTGNSTTLWAIVDITGLAAGSYSGTITVTGAAGTQNSLQTVTVNLTVNAACTNTAPSVTTLSSPSNGATGQSTSPTVSWNAVASWGTNCAGNNNTYEVFLDTNSNPTTSRGAVAGGTTSKSISGLANNTLYYWKVRASNGALSTDSAIWSFTTAPSSPYVLDKTMCDDSTGSGGGVVSAQSISSPTQVDAISARSWVVTGYNNVDFPTYLELQTMYGYDDPTTNPIAADPLTTDLSEITSSGIYKIERDFTLASTPCTLPGSPVAVIFVNGDLDITANFRTTAINLGEDPLGYRNECGSSLAFIVKGDITIAPTVNNIYGIFYAGGDVGMITDPSPNPLYVFGSLLAHDFDLKRNLGANNSTYPAEQVIFMPKYLITLKDILGRPQYSWKEVKTP